MQCRNCKENVLVRHEREGLIHENGFYACHETIKNEKGNKKVIRLDTVAE